MNYFKCYNCIDFNKCLNNALENISVRCLDFGELKVQVDRIVDKINSIGLSPPWSKGMIKSFILLFMDILMNYWRVIK